MIAHDLISQTVTTTRMLTMTFRAAAWMPLVVMLSGLIAGEAQVPPGAAPGIRERLAEAPPSGERIRESAAPLRFEPAVPVTGSGDPLAAEVPTDVSFRMCGVFTEPLIPFGGQPGEGNAELARALKAAVTDKGFRPEPIERFLAQHGEARWRLSVLVGLGQWYRNQGYHRSAERCLTAALDLGLTRSEPTARSLAMVAAADLATLYAWAVSVERLDPLLARIAQEPVSGRVADALDYARSVSRRAAGDPEMTLTCGPYAVAALLAFQGNTDLKTAEARVVGIMTAQGSYAAKKPATGVPAHAATVEDVIEIAAGAGLDMVAIRVPRGQPVPVPSIIHWSLDHFSTVLEARDGRYRVADLSADSAVMGFGEWRSGAAIEESGSGVYIVPAQSVGPGVQRVSQEERRSVWGRGYSPAATNAGTSCDASTGGDCARKMPVWELMLQAVALRVRDTPWWQDMPRGPALSLDLAYNDRETAVPTVPSTSHLGPRWTLAWLSRVERAPGSSSVVYYPSGGGEFRITLNGESGRHHMMGGTMTFTGATRAVLAMDDGAAIEFTSVSSVSSVFPMTRVVSAQGDIQLRLGYDALNRLVSVDQGPGDGYRAELLYTNATDALLITGVRTTIVSGTTVAVVPGRSASLGYDGQGRLVSLTDMGGLTSTLAYDAAQGGKIGSLTTPYGTSQFTRWEGTGVDRWIRATDAAGDAQRVESRTQSTTAPEPTGTIPVGMALNPDNQFLHFRNVFYWDRKAYRMTTWANPDAQAEATALATATIYHFLHDGGNAVVGRVIESIKRPGENRIYYLYPGQTNVLYEAGMTTSQPREIAQRLADGTTSIQRFTYTPGRQIDLVTDPLGRQVKAHYHPNGIDIAEMRGSATAGSPFLGGMTWDSDHRPTGITGPDGRTTRITYGTDPNQPTYGRVLRVDPPQRAGMPVESSTFAYILTGIHAGRLYQTIDPAGPSATYAYDNLGRVASVVDRDGYSLAFQYDSLDRLVQVTYPDGTYEQVVWDKLDPTWTRDRMGRWSRTIFNAIRQPIASMDPEGRVTAFEWCRCGSLQKLIDPLGRITKWTYDARSRLTAKTWPDGTQTTYTYEPDFNATTAPNGSTGRLIAVTDAKGQQRRFTYTRDGALASVTYYNPGGTISATTPAVSYQYDPDFPRLVSTSDGIGTTLVEYHPYLTAAQRPVGATQPVTPLTTWPGAVARVDGPLDGPVDPDEMVVGRFDEWGRVVSATVSGLAETLAFNDTLGRVTGYSNALGNFSLGYAGNTGRVNGLTRPFGVSTTLTYQGMAQDFKLASLSHKVGAANVSTHSYGYLTLPDGTGSDGTISSWTMSNSAVGAQAAQTVDWSFGYDGIRQLVSATKKVNGSVVESLGYVYDEAGNRTAQQREAGGSFSVTSSTVNAANQLQSTSPGGTVRVAGSTNEPATVRVNGQPARLSAGNRFEAEVPAGSSNTQFTVQATDAKGNQRTTTYQVANAGVPARGYQYDLNGNTISATVAGQPSLDKTFVYDVADRLITIIYPGTNNRTEFAYNGAGQRVKQTEWTNGTPVVTWFVWRGARVALTATGTDSTSLTITRRFWADGMDYQGTKYLVTRDHLGSVREIISATGAVRARYDYDVYGTRTKVASAGDVVDTEVGYTGHWHHSRSGLILSWYRAYDAISGRWINRDPIGEAGGVNVYGYVGGGVINGVDVLGLAESQPIPIPNFQPIVQTPTTITIPPPPTASYPLGSNSLWPGLPFDGSRDFRGVRPAINFWGSIYGCHTCGRSDPGPGLRNWIADHSPHVSHGDGNHRIYAQCAGCSHSQGGHVRWGRICPPSDPPKMSFSTPPFKPLGDFKPVSNPSSGFGSRFGSAISGFRITLPRWKADVRYFDCSRYFHADY